MQSLYFGGGTPSLLNTNLIKQLCDVCFENFNFTGNPEVTLETNPATIDRKKAAQLRTLPINRISLGFQSCDNGILEQIGRPHTAEESTATFNILRDTGFDNISIDLIFGLPMQTEDQWSASLHTVVQLNPEHISLYCFSYDEGSEFFAMHQKKLLPQVDESLTTQMFMNGIQYLKSHGYKQYEISNFARPGYESRHNKLYWHNLPYAGFGSGAYSYLNGERFCSIRDIEGYIHGIRHNDIIFTEKESLSLEDSMRETAALNMRLIEEGINVAALQERYPTTVPEQTLHAAIQSLIADALVWITPDQRICLTDKGVLFADHVASQLL